MDQPDDIGRMPPPSIGSPYQVCHRFSSRLVIAWEISLPAIEAGLFEHTVSLPLSDSEGAMGFFRL